MSGMVKAMHETRSFIKKDNRHLNHKFKNPQIHRRDFSRARAIRRKGASCSHSTALIAIELLPRWLRKSSAKKVRYEQIQRDIHHEFLRSCARTYVLSSPILTMNCVQS